jgi:methionyl-tRNA formyltransferase
MRLVFLGSPEFAVPTLRALARGHEVALVVTRPDRPRGRSARPQPTAVKEAALELGLAVLQPESARDPEAIEAVRQTGADLAVTVAYGEVLSPDMLAATPQGFLNLHASLLPAYRGAAPVNWAVIRGERRTGVSVIRMAPRLDAGPILAQRETNIGPDETAGELEERLSRLGAEVTAEVVDRLAAWEHVPGRPQPASGGFFARKLTKADGKIDWELPAGQIRSRVRGLTPWPGALAEFRGRARSRQVVLLRVEAAGEAQVPALAPAGAVLDVSAEGIVVRAGRGTVTIGELKPAGSRAMAAADFARGHGVGPGDMFA